MSDGERIELHRAETLAHVLRGLLWPACVSIVVAGSVRRRRPDVGDLELVAQPKRRPAAQTSLFGGRDGGAGRSALWDLVDELVAGDTPLERHPPRVHTCPACDGNGGCGAKPCSRCQTTGSVDRAAAWGDRYRKLLWRGVPVDLFTASADTWGAILLVRTGPPAYSQAWVTALRGHGLRLKDGTVRDIGGRRVRCHTEAEAHRLAGWRYREPWERDQVVARPGWAEQSSLAGR